VKKTPDEYAVRSPTVTVTGPNVALPVAVTKMESADETDGVPKAVPKRTTLLAGVGEKFEPRMVTRVGYPPLIGEKEVMVGTWAEALVQQTTTRTRTVAARFIQASRGCELYSGNAD
jgi:hypothetical protein